MPLVALTVVALVNIALVDVPMLPVVPPVVKFIVLAVIVEPFESVMLPELVRVTMPVPAPIGAPISTPVPVIVTLLLPAAIAPVTLIWLPP